MKNPATLLLVIALGSVGLMAAAHTKPSSRIVDVEGRTYRITRRADGRYMVEQIGSENAVIFSIHEWLRSRLYGDYQISCKGDCEQIKRDMRKFPTGVFK